VTKIFPQKTLNSSGIQHIGVYNDEPTSSSRLVGKYLFRQFPLNSDTILKKTLKSVIIKVRKKISYPSKVTRLTSP
jgi:hypothetical protein